MSASGTDITSRSLLLIGDASYAIYLTHTIAMIWAPSLAAAGLPPADTSTAAMLVVGICIVIGVVVHLAIEKPIGRRLRRFARRGTEASLRLSGRGVTS
jgi:exopolysaccharide production protein ExoZ